MSGTDGFGRACLSERSEYVKSVWILGIFEPEKGTRASNFYGGFKGFCGRGPVSVYCCVPLTC